MKPSATVERLGGGELLIRSGIPAGTPDPTTLHWLFRWAERTPHAVFLTALNGTGGQRAELSYLQARNAAASLAAGLRRQGLQPGDRVLVAAPNGIIHLQIALGATLAGLIYVPVAPQYVAAGASADKLRAVLDLIEPALIYVDDSDGAALLRREPNVRVGEADLADLMAPPRDGAPALSELNPDAIARILLTSGSTGTPKAVTYTHRMMTSNMQMTQDVWPFLLQHKPVLVDWLPWNHAFGGNANLGLVLCHGGTLHVDEAAGRPDRLNATIENIRRFRPTFHGAVPAAFAALLPILEVEGDVRQAMFERLDVMFSAGAAMTDDVYRRLSDVSAAVRGEPVPIVTGWGATETGPGATMVHTAHAEPGWIGPPMPGVQIRLVPVHDKLELRVHSASVTAGYWRRADLTDQAFDEHGYYRTGDAGQLVDPDHPELGLRFDGRIAEDFKLANGSWVNVARLRNELLRCGAGMIRDVAFVGPNRPSLTALLWTTGTARLAESDITAILHAHNAVNTGQTSRVVRAAVLDPPPQPEMDELNLKGQLNQRVLLITRQTSINHLYAAKEQALP